MHVEVKIKVRGEQRESTEVKNSASRGRKAGKYLKVGNSLKFWEVAAAGE